MRGGVFATKWLPNWLGCEPHNYGFSARRMGPTGCRTVLKLTCSFCWYKSVNFGAETSMGSPYWCSQIDRDRARSRVAWLLKTGIDSPNRCSQIDRLGHTVMTGGGVLGQADRADDQAGGLGVGVDLFLMSEVPLYPISLPRRRTAQWTSSLSLPHKSRGYVTKFAPHKALQSIEWVDLPKVN